jgi:DNA-binding NtrC family response regulator
VDVRIITASNADLEALIAENRFREDLYYRLKVLTIRTPPLREHPEDIPALARHFLQEQGRLRGTPVLGLSRGALEKMKLYHWPGNVRELENCIIRASVMAESRIIQAEDLQIGACSAPIDDEPEGPATRAAGTGRSRIAAGGESHRTVDEPHPEGLNPRQQKGLPWIRRRASVSRSEYQEMVGGDLPARTAVYDLNDLVKKGLLVRTGKGPSTRYRWGTEAGGDAEEKE